MTEFLRMVGAVVELGERHFYDACFLGVMSQHRFEAEVDGQRPRVALTYGFRIIGEKAFMPHRVPWAGFAGIDFVAGGTRAPWAKQILF